MSFNRENVIWPSRDGTWSIGFYACYVRPDAEDHEWDVDYDFDRFEWVSTGHPTEDKASEAWDGANPGGSTIVREVGLETDALDAMAAKFIADSRSAAGHRGYR
ncbi:hypothetical protein [Stenotrophomonas maltophilia]|uniref:hypothetical protein n=1 Tax=Stenotrophomonas maltophilia TaxID=40324 RepID=UPI0021C5870D|nr:hypothetical protein [Stenotrophomonas maltophilia]MCU1137032.1 hypothetical protein [Stenotrophomonas maltophilia]